MITDADLAAFVDGTHSRLSGVLGAHPDTTGTAFSVWAPRARAVSVVTDANDWEGSPLTPREDGSGIWEGHLEGAGHGEVYKYAVTGEDGRTVQHADPFAVHTETPPANGSKIWRLDHDWGDHDWMAGRSDRQRLDAPVSIYELHLGSWMRGEDGRRHLSYRELIPHLVDHVQRLGFTHVEFLPLAEHPFYGSWGYQGTGYFAPTSRYGAPEDLMALIDALHQAGIGVILDWVPSHFPDDWWGLARFDGQPLYEHPDPQRGRHPDWNSAVFDYGRGQVRSFLLSSALWWLRTYHADGLRVDAVASMLYLDHSRDEGEWTPNEHGGNEHLEAVAFLRQLTSTVHQAVPDALLCAEESESWPGVTHPVAEGGLGFDLKWDMGWSHDVLSYLQADPIMRSGMQQRLTFHSTYSFDEAFVLALSHDDAVPRSVRGRLHGDGDQQAAHLRALLGLAFTQPGKPLVFAGTEFGTDQAWDVDSQLDWPFAHAEGAALLRWTAALATTYRQLPALHAGDADPDGFSWLSGEDADHSVIAFHRHDPATGATVLVVGHFTPVTRPDYGLGVASNHPWRVRLHSDEERFGGAGTVVAPDGIVTPSDQPAHGRTRSLRLTLPPLSLLVLTPLDG